MPTYELDKDELEAGINTAIKVYLEYMLDFEMIEEEIYDFLIKNTAVIIKKPSFFNKMWNKLFQSPNKEHYIVVVQQSMNDPDDEESEENSEQRKAKILKLITKKEEKKDES